VILCSLLSPIGALLFDELRRSHRWLIAYLVPVKKNLNELGSLGG
jgi:hypothetical protein